MGKLDHFTINFRTQPAVFFPGQTVAGVVNVKLNGGMKIRNLRLKYEGKALVHWSQTRYKRDTIQFRSENEYFSQEVVLWGNPLGSDADSPTMPAGKHTMPFQFVLPYNIPASFEGSCSFVGYVRYSVKATIVKPWKFNHETKVAFTVASFYDLNMVPHARNPAHAKDHEHHCCYCCKSGPITVTVHLEKSGFVAGEKIICQGEISNLSNVKINSWTMQLIQRVDFTACYVGYFGDTLSNTLHTEQVLAAYHDSIKIEEGEEKHISCELEVPAVPCSELLFCDFIVINYFIKLIVSPKRTNDLKVIAPITIGNVPLRSELAQISPPIAAPGAMMPTMMPMVPPPPGVDPTQPENLAKN